MARSVLLQLVRDSMLEVFQAKRNIDKVKLLQDYPVLAEAMNVKVAIYLDAKLKNSYTTTNNDSLLENILIASKKAAFEDEKHPPLSVSGYLHAEIELTLFGSEGDMSEKDPPLLQDDNPMSILAYEESLKTN